MADRDFERELVNMLHAEAPLPSPDLAERILRQTAATPQRSTWLRFSMVPALATAAVVVAAVFAGSQFGRWLDVPPASFDTGATTGASVGASPSPALPTTTPPASGTPGASPGGQRCTNETDGYTVEYPDGWYANEEIPAAEGLDGIAACRFFGPAPFELQPNAGVPPGAAIGFQRVEQEPPVGGSLISSDTVSVAGTEATVREFEVEAGGFVPPGTLYYEYVIPLDAGYFVVSTDSSRDGNYDENRRVLDLMMESLSLEP
jgi:hypothetical protein